VLEQTGYVMQTCYTWSGWHQNTDPHDLPPGAKEIRTTPTRVVGRRWSWRGELAVVEAIGLEPGTASAHRRFLACSDASSPDFDPDDALYGEHPESTTQELPLGDEAALTTVRRQYQTVTSATVRVGRYVITVVERLDGDLSSGEALVPVLRAALDQARGIPVDEVARVPRGRTPEDLVGMLSTADLPHVHGERGVVWGHDEPLTWRSDRPKSLYCLSAVTSDPGLTTTAQPVERIWLWPSRAVDNPVDQAFQLIVGRAPDETTAKQEFGECRSHALDYPDGEAPYELRDVPDLGDEAYLLVRKRGQSGFSSTPVIVRSGTTYVVVWAHELGIYESANPDGAVAVARAALAALRAAGR
jgi:hypothetical protein